MRKGKGGHEKEGENTGDGRAVQRMGEAVGIISKGWLYPGTWTEGPVCASVCVSFAPVVLGAGVLRPHS